MYVDIHMFIYMYIYIYTCVYTYIQCFPFRFFHKFCDKRSVRCTQDPLCQYLKGGIFLCRGTTFRAASFAHRVSQQVLPAGHGDQSLSASDNHVRYD